MKKFSIIMISIISLLFLAGCGKKLNSDQVINETTVLACMKQDSIKKSEEGKNLTYYYINPSDIAIYYVEDWKKGVISLKKYFWDTEQFNMQKELYSDARVDEDDLTVYVREYSTVDDMDAYWEQTENSSTYTMVK